MKIITPLLSVLVTTAWLLSPTLSSAQAGIAGQAAARPVPPRAVWPRLVGQYPFHTVSYHAVVANASSLPPKDRAAVQAIRVGMTRREFDGTSFRLENGLGQMTVGESCYSGAGGVFLYVTFAASDPSQWQDIWNRIRYRQRLTETEGDLLLFGSPQDTVTAVSVPWVYVPLTPSPKKPPPCLMTK